MKKNALFLLRCACFLLMLLLLVVFGNRFLIQQDTIAYLTMEEIHNRTDIKTAIIGSSIAQLHFDPSIIESHTGEETMCATITNLGLPGMLAMTRELFETNSPKTVILAVEGYTFQYVSEDIQTQFKLMPHLTSLSNKREYFHNLMRHDGLWPERMLMMNSFGFASWTDVYKAFALRHDAKAYFDTLLDEFGDPMTYDSGYVPALAQTDLAAIVREELGMSDEHAGGIFDFSKEMLLAIRDVCEENGAQLLVIAYPALSVHAVAEPFYLEYLDYARAFCRDNSIPFHNFTYAREEFMPCLDAYYFDLHHFNKTGAEIFSDVFGRFLLMLQNGEDVEPLFKYSRYEYLDSLGEKRDMWVSLLTEQE